MAEIIGIETPFGILIGRDAIYLESINYVSETELVLKGEFELKSKSNDFEISFTGILYFSSTELDFDTNNQMVSFGRIPDSGLIQQFKSLDHSNKLKPAHTHYYFRTYDTVFEVIAEQYSFKA